MYNFTRLSHFLLLIVHYEFYLSSESLDSFIAPIYYLLEFLSRSE